MDSQLLNYAQAYLSTILSLNILLATASGFLLYKSLGYIKCNCSKILLILSIIFSICAICSIVYSYQKVFEYLLVYKSMLPISLNFKKSFENLDGVFYLNIFSLILTTLAVIVMGFRRICER